MGGSQRGPLGVNRVAAGAPHERNALKADIFSLTQSAIKRHSDPQSRIAGLAGILALVDHPVGAQQDRLRHVDAERFRRLHVG
jgi:hypothetical protein